MKSRIRKLRNGLLAEYPIWVIASVCIALLLLIPLISIIYFASTGVSAEWEHIANNLLGQYAWNSLLLVLGVGLGVSILGVISSAVIVFIDFPGKKFFEWALILPLSIPAYLLGFSYAELCGYEGWISRVMASPIDILNVKGAIFIFSFSLFPYVYLPLKLFFTSQAFQLLEAGQSLGKGVWSSFFRLVLPLAIPVISGGVLLVGMEVLNDYGLSKYFGIPTFTIGIFRAWTGFGDLTAALRLSCMLLFIVSMIIWVQKIQGRNQRITQNIFRKRRKLKRSVGLSVLAWLVCGTILCLGFLLPFMQMVFGVLATAHRVLDLAFLEAALNSLKLAGVTALLVVLIAVLVEFTSRINPRNWSSSLAKQTVAFGYSIPGAVIAMGVLVPVTIFDKWLFRISSGNSWLISTSVMVLFYALVVRYMAVGIQTLSSGYGTLSPNLLNASRSLGHGPKKSLLTVDLPLLKNYLLSAFILVFVDVLKELPLTMILRPFNFDTLATKAFSLASDELLREAANASILIVLIGMLPIFVLNRLMKNVAS